MPTYRQRLPQVLLHCCLMFSRLFRWFQPAVIELHLLAGQSNAQGYQGDAANYPRGLERLDKRILFWYESRDYEGAEVAWGNMRPQTGRFPDGYFGPEVTFSRALCRQVKHPAIFKFSAHSTSLAKDWKAAGQGGLYDDMCASLKAALAGLQKTYPRSLIKFGSFIWIQGESDAAEDASALAYEASLREMLAHLRTVVLKEPALPVILGVDEEHPWVLERPQVVEAQQRIAAGDAHVVFTSMRGIKKIDASHLPPDGLAEHGDRLFEAYHRMIHAVSAR